MILTRSDRVLVTGGTGFIGRHIVSRLAAIGVRPLITAYDGEPADIAASGPAGADIIECDIRDTDGVTKLLHSFRPNIVVHLAGVSGHNDPDGRLCDEINFEATKRLLMALVEICPRRVVLFGTAAEYGDQAPPFRETMIPRPLSFYALSRARASEVALDLFATRGLPVVILRLFSVYGPGQPAKMFVSQLVTHGILNHYFKMSSGAQRRDLVHVEDVASAIVAAIERDDAVGKVFNIGKAIGSRLSDVSRSVWTVCGADPANLGIGAIASSGEDACDTQADISLAATVLGWRPTISLARGLSDTISHIRASLPKDRVEGPLS